jgi:hypothetical protein
VWLHLAGFSETSIAASRGRRETHDQPSEWPLANILIVALSFFGRVFADQHGCDAAPREKFPEHRRGNHGWVAASFGLGAAPHDG